MVVTNESAVAERLAGSAPMVVASASGVAERLTFVPTVVASASAVAEKMVESVSDPTVVASASAVAEKQAENVSDPTVVASVSAVAEKQAENVSDPTVVAVGRTVIWSIVPGRLRSDPTVSTAGGTGAETMTRVSALTVAVSGSVEAERPTR